MDQELPYKASTCTSHSLRISLFWMTGGISFACLTGWTVRSADLQKGPPALGATERGLGTGGAVGRGV